VFAGGLLYGSAGDIVDPSIPAIVGRFPAQGFVGSEPGLNRTCFAYTDGNASTRLLVFDNVTRQNLKSISIPATINMNGGQLLSWGSDGLGFVEAGGPGSRVYLFHAPSQ
jgi:hypothetical protein